MGFIRVSCKFSLGFLWDASGFPPGFLLVFGGFPAVFQWVPARFPAGLLRVSCGFPVCFLWVSGGLPAGFLRVSGGFPAGSLWVSNPKIYDFRGPFLGPFLGPRIGPKLRLPNLDLTVWLGLVASMLTVRSNRCLWLCDCMRNVTTQGFSVLWSQPQVP